MDASLLQQQRKQLKLLLLRERQAIFGYRFRPQCAYCGLELADGADMHEVFLTKGDLRGATDLLWLLNDRRNCVLVHPGGNTSVCHAGAATKAGQVIVVRHLVYWEGAAKLYDYAELTHEHLLVRYYIEIKSLIAEAEHDMQGLQARD